VTFTLGDELDFVLATFERALRLLSRLPALPPDAPPEILSRDGELLASFDVHAAAFRAALLESEPPLDVLRSSATDAYVAVRTAHELRRPPAAEGPVELLAFDAEDRFLAGIR